MKKKMISFLLVCVMLVMSAVPAVASTEIAGLSQSEIIQSLSDLENKYEFISFETVETAGESRTFSRTQNSMPTLKFDTVEELEEFLMVLESEAGTKELPEVLIDSADLNPLTRRYNGLSTGSLWIPFVNAGTGLFCWFHTDVTYRYDFDRNNQAYFTGATGASSYMSGISLSSWTQTAYVQNIVNNTIRTQVNGQWLVGIEVFGLTVGARVNDSYSWVTSFK